jgi:2-polyprenyl-3-methyl-5-hydroxy-6-metoxy-1,4-benzoquinol methylase
VPRRALALFPCNPQLATRLCDYAFGELAVDEIDALTLSGQSAVNEQVDARPFARRFRLDERFYGRLEQESSLDVLAEAAARDYAVAVFPAGAFNGNGFLLGASLATAVRCVNVSHEGAQRLVVDVPGRGGLDFPSPVAEPSPGWDAEALAQVLRRLEEQAAEVEQLEAASHGERPAAALAHGYPYDLEVFVRYLWAARACRGRRVLEVGSGVGYGAYVLAREAASVVAVEPDAPAVAFSSAVWAPLADGRLSFEQGTVETHGGEGYERIVCFEVLEHVEDPGALLATFRSLLAPGGLLLLSTPDPARFPFRVNEARDLESSPEDLLAQGIWKWHLSGIPPQEGVRLALAAGFDTATVLQPGFAAGPARLAAVRDAPDRAAALRRVDEAVRWSLDDFDVAAEVSPAFSAFSYVLAARRAG